MSTPAQRLAASKARATHRLTAKFMEGFDFPFDEFQIQSLHCVEDGKGLLVAAPTGAGKTVVGEFAAFLALEKGKKCSIQLQSKLSQIRSLPNSQISSGSPTLDFLPVIQTLTLKRRSWL